MLKRDIEAILDSGNLSGFRGNTEGHSGGYWVQVLEESFKEYFNIKYAVAMNSATACLHAACVACGLTYGDDVLVTPYSFVSSVSCLNMVNANEVFADIDEDTFNITKFSLLREWQTSWFSATIPVHLMGHPCDLDELKSVIFEHGYIIEDAAQAIGAKYKGKLVGTIGDCGIFSFNQSKQISCGEGGMLITNNSRIARIARAMRNHGEVSDPMLRIVGYNYRMGEIEARIVIEQFKYLDENLTIRQELAEYMTEKLSQIEGLVPPVVKDYCTRHAWYTYGVKWQRKDMTRDQFQKEMMRRGVFFGSGYVKPIHLLPIYNNSEGLCPVAERMWK